MIDELIEELRGIGATEKELSLLFEYGWMRDERRDND